MTAPNMLGQAMFPGRGESVAAARMFVRRALIARYGTVVEDVVLLTSELVANAIRHSDSGRLPDGTTLAEAIEAVDAVAPPAYFLVNCAHPSHILRGLDDGPWRDRIGGLRVNASTMSHAELDEAETLDDGDPEQLAAEQAPLLDAFANLQVLGGCCGTDARHVAAMWGVQP